MLHGVAVPASSLERLVLTARVADYTPAYLDELCAAGEMVWAGAGSIGGNDGWLHLAFADAAGLVLPPENPDAVSSAVHEAILAALDAGQALFFRAIADRVTGGPGHAAGGRLAWRDTADRGLTADDRTTRRDTDAGGAATGGGLAERDPGGDGPTGHGGLAVDDADVAGPSGISCGAATCPTTRSRGPGAPRRGPGPTRRRPFRPALATGARPAGLVPPGLRRRAHRDPAGRPAPSMAGRWYRLPERDLDPTRRAAAAADSLLDRHGVVTRGAVMAEGVTGGFAGVYPVLAALEERGAARRGYFVEGLGAAQFAVPGAVDRLRSLAETSAVGRGAVVLASTDPANRTARRCPGRSASSTTARRPPDPRPAGTGPAARRVRSWWSSTASSPFTSNAAGDQVTAVGLDGERRCERFAATRHKRLREGHDDFADMLPTRHEAERRVDARRGEGTEGERRERAFSICSASSRSISRVSVYRR